MHSRILSARNMEIQEWVKSLESWRYCDEEFEVLSRVNIHDCDCEMEIL